ncbi:MAG: hypothetical protein II737_04965 [Mailhella sp.]|nr:hypothetical protein [Mailhella sp.]
MEWKIAGSVIVALVVACAVLYVMHLKDAEENAALKTALAQQSAVLAETQAELALRDAVIKKRDAALAEAERRKEQAEGKYARLVRTSKVVRDWDVVLLPDDVNSLLKAGASGAAVSAGDADNGGGHP